MESLHNLLNFILHIDNQLISFISHYGVWTYALLFLIIFCETGLIFLPFLPGDSLLFAAGALIASTASLNIHMLFLLLVAASILGNTLNYYVGRFLGPKVFHSQNSRLLNKKHLQHAHDFYKRFGGKTIIIARFMPIIRSFAPFVAGIAAMNSQKFFFYNVISAFLWIGSLSYLGYLFGNLPIIKENFSTVILAIIAISLMPPLFEMIRQKLKSP